MKPWLLAFAICVPLAAQAPVVDRAAGAGSTPLPQRIEQGAKGFVGDTFRLGDNKAETWMIEAMRLWAIPESSPACSKGPGDAIEKLTLYGALYNEPIPGQPECDCHALIAVVDAPMQKGGSRFVSSNVTLTPAGKLWQVDFRDVRWSVPGGADVLFTLRATTRPGQSCPAGKTWTLAAAPAEPGYRLHLFDLKRVPAGFAEPDPQPRQIYIQIWAHKY